MVSEVLPPADQRVLVLLNRLTTVRKDAGFTLVELLIVLVIIGILLATATPVYRGLKARASDSAAKAQLRAAAAAAQAYAYENVGAVGDADNSAATSGYQGMTTARLRNYDRGIKTGTGAMTVLAAQTNQTQYCIRITVSSRNWSLRGPAITLSAYKNNLTCA
jgi:prepilin-type N-terminal cleavage/methylation domain-containing protein